LYRSNTGLTYGYKVKIAAQTGLLGVHPGWACTSAGSKRLDVRRGTAAINTISTDHVAKMSVKEQQQVVQRQVQQLAGADPDEELTQERSGRGGERSSLAVHSGSP
jgi:hypothetical protein